MTTQQQFLDLLSDIEPSTTTVNDCSSAHNTLRNALKVHNEFSKVHVHTFLSGSSLYTTNFIGPLSYQAFSFLKLRALS
ncbi:SMODS domain-containing nucleotidyltransferase [Acinetobacter haemolyticus]|uniref:SMODS domain-containing nucleotidyltransferase n=1 Tax=Acinetobacter haemolyticus TaxID=29430 RepID=UPI0022488267|nr:hypothetical protein [Acinetobacter haemolyticus]